MNLTSYQLENEIALMQSAVALAASFEAARRAGKFSVMDPTLYDDWRQYLKALPALVKGVGTGDLGDRTTTINAKLKEFDARLAAVTGVSSGATKLIDDAAAKTAGPVDKAIADAKKALGEELGKQLDIAARRLDQTAVDTREGFSGDLTKLVLLVGGGFLLYKLIVKR